MSIKTTSPLDYLRNKNPNNPLRLARSASRDANSRMIANIESDSIDDFAPDLGNAGLGSTGVRADGTFQVLRLSYIDHAAGTYFTTTLPADSLIEDNIVEFEVTGRIFNNTGGNLNLLAQTFMEDGGSSLVSSGSTLTVGSSTSYRMFNYKVRIQQAPCMGNWVQCDEELRVDNLTPMLKSTITELSGGPTNIDEEMELWFQLGWSGATSYVNIRTIYNTWTLKLIDGVSDYQKRFWTQPTGTRGYDTRINSNTATTNYGNGTLLYAGETNGAVATSRTLIRFNDLTNLPRRAVIDSAILWLCIQDDASSNARTYEVYRVIRNWVAGDGSAGSGATWNTYDGTNNWSTAGCGNSTTDYDGSVVLASASLSASEALGTMIPFSLNTSEIQKFVDGTYNNYGFLIKAQTEANDMYVFYSADHATVTLAPLLEVTYHVP